MQVIAGLGNPGEQYRGTRHNVGKEFLEALKNDLPSKVKVAELGVYMNNSGAAIKKAIPSAKAAKGLLVLHDELDLPLGAIKLSFGAGAGGHQGVASIIKALKTQDFARIRIGISPADRSGKAKRPEAKDIADFVLGKFKPGEREKLKKAKKVVARALELIVTEGIERAMTEINAR